MKIPAETCSFMFLCVFLSSGQGIHAFSYDYSATTKCLVEPRTVHYGGGIIVNPEFNHGMKAWNLIGKGAIREGISKEGNRFIMAHNRTRSFDGFSQKVQLEKGKIYSFSAWVQISEGSETVTAVFRKSNNELIRGGRVIAKQGCWSLLKGGIFANSSSLVDILFESRNITVDILVDNVSLQPFTKKQWRSHQDESIEKVRKRNVRFQVTYTNKTQVEGAKISIKQIKSSFPFGCGMNHNILTSTAYQDWFASRFKFTTFTNEMKWYSTEKKQGQENYTISDAMVRFAKQNGVSIRGHNIFWDDPKYQPDWVKELSSEELYKAAERRINSVVSRYSGQLIAWDVVNENLHFSFFEDKLGKNASAVYFSTAYRLDPKTTMFMNEYNTIEYKDDEASSPENYRKKFKEILSFPASKGMLAGIGLQGHFGSDQPNIAYMRSCLDALATMGLPIWLTEVDVGKSPNQALYLEEILREGYSHPAVQGIIMFAGPAVAGFNVTTLADKDFKNTPAGDAVDKLIDDWSSRSREIAAHGREYYQISLFHGDYTFTVNHPVTNSSVTQSFKVTKDIPRKIIHVQIDA